jgi:hypothetical protein
MKLTGTLFIVCCRGPIKCHHYPQFFCISMHPVSFIVQKA